GYFVTRLQERLPLSAYRRPLLGTGICGGLSTFSTMQVEILKMISAGAWGLAAGYTAASIAAGYVALHLATALVRRVPVRLETQRLAEERQLRKAVLNVVVSLVLGVAAAALGRLIGAHL